MATLGNSTATGLYYYITGTYNQASSDTFTVPNPGIYVTQLSAMIDGDGASPTAWLYVWSEGLNWLVRSGTFTLNNKSQGAALDWWNRTDLAFSTGYSDGYIPGGTNVWIGAFSNTPWQMRCDANGSGSTWIGTGGDGNWSNGTRNQAANVGRMAAYLTYNLAAPHVTSYSPSSGKVGDSVTITGYAFTGATAVKFNGVTASYTVNSNTQITATVPSGATTGPISVTNAQGTGNGPTFTVYAIWVYDGTNWQQSPVNAYDGSAWQQCIQEAYDGTNWQNTI